MIWIDIQALIRRFRYFLTLTDRDTVHDWELSDKVESVCLSKVKSARESKGKHEMFTRKREHKTMEQYNVRNIKDIMEHLLKDNITFLSEDELMSILQIKRNRITCPKCEGWLRGGECENCYLSPSE